MRFHRRTTILIGLVALAIPAACGSGDDDASGTAPAPLGPAAPGDGYPTTIDNPSSSGGGGLGNEAGNGNGDAPEPALPYVDFDVNHVISTGQSNSVAHGGRPVITTTQPFTNLMFDVGVMTAGVCEQQGCRVYQKPNAFVPLTEGDMFWYPVETMSSGLANEGAMLAMKRQGKTKHDILVSLAGRNGLTYWCLRKGGCTYTDPTYVGSFDETLRQVADAKALAAAAGRSYVVRIATAIHGESDDFGYATGSQEFPLDGSDGTSKSLASYADALIEWQHDLEVNVQAATGQTLPIPLLISQFSGWNDAPTSSVTRLQYEAHVRAKGKVVIVTPGYVLDWGPDCRHYTNDGERRLGEYFGKAYNRIVLEGRRWEPLRPSTVTHAGAVVTAKFVVPAPPLVIDTERVVDPGHYGFEAVDAAGVAIAITNVALAGPDTVAITLAATPADGARLRYAFTGIPRSCPGRTLGPRGNLRDSDTTPSQYGYELFNWALHFEVPIE